MKLKLLIIAVLLLITAGSMVVKTQSAYAQNTGFSVSIVPDAGHADGPAEQNPT